MVVALIVVTIILLLGLMGVIVRIKKLETLLIEFDREQHDQNKLLIDLVKDNQQMKEMLLQHIEILQFLCDRDPLLNKTRFPYTGPVGEA